MRRPIQSSRFRTVAALTLAACTAVIHPEKAER